MLKKFNRLISSFLIVVLLTVSLVFSSPDRAYAGIPIDLQTAKDTVKNVMSNADTLKNLLSNPKLITDTVTKVVSNKQLAKDVKKFLYSSPQQFCRAYVKYKNGTDSHLWDGIIKGGSVIATIGQRIGLAEAAGAGSLSGYAGIASAVSHLSLNGLTQTIAGLLGSNVTGAAATAVVTSTVGGPVVMGGLITVGLGATAIGSVELTKIVANHLGEWAEDYCEIASLKS